MFLSASLENTPNLPNLFLFSVNAERPANLFVSAPNYPSECRVMWKAAGSTAGPKPRFSYWYCTLTKTVCLVSEHLSHVDLPSRWTKQRVGERTLVSVFLEGKSLPRQFWQCTCEDSVANSEYSTINVNILLSPFFRSGVSCGVDATGRAVCQLCGQSLKGKASWGSRSLSGDKNQHLLLTHSRAILSTEDLDSLYP